MAITAAEFARRLCVLDHPHYDTTGNRVPCGQHQTEASRFWGLITAEGTQKLGLIEDVRRENGLPNPERFHVTLREGAENVYDVHDTTIEAGSWGSSNAIGPRGYYESE